MTPRALAIDPGDAVPIWKQIEDGIRRLVASGSLAPGEAVTSVRDLAQELRVNPATISKAYQQLVAAGVLEVRRGDGTYVSATPPDLGRAGSRRELADGALRYAALAATLGATKRDAVDELGAAWARLAPTGKRGER